MSKQYRRVISPFSMLLCSVTTIIGSGWLFSSYISSQIAGPGAILSWVIGAALVLVVAFTFAELSTLLPVPGGSSHIPHVTHGTLVSLVLGWISWLSISILPAIETQAVLQYASFFFPSLITGQESGALSHYGLMVATLLMICFSIINIYSMRWVLRVNNVIAIWKIIVPIIAAITLIAFGFKRENFAVHGFMPEGWKGVFQAISAGGIVFAYNGFKTVVEMAGEASNPRKTIPFAIISSIVVCMVVYLLLQIAFLGGVSPSALLNGWGSLQFAGDASPLITLMVGVGGVVILALLYVNTIVAPMGAGLVYATSGARILQAMGKNKQMPHFLELTNKKGIPVQAILINLVIGMAFFFPFPGWRAMMDFISSLMAFSYALGPICLLVLRYQMPKQARPFKLPFVHVWSFMAFFVCTLMCYWTGWTVISKLILFLMVCLGCYTLYRVISPRARELSLSFKPSMWLWVYFVGLGVISYLGDFGGGQKVLTFGPDFLAIGLLSLVTMMIAVRYRVSDSVVAAKFAHINNEYSQHKDASPLEEPDEPENAPSVSVQNPA